MKKILSLVLVLALVMGLSASAFATDLLNTELSENAVPEGVEISNVAQEFIGIGQNIYDFGEEAGEISTQQGQEMKTLPRNATTFTFTDTLDNDSQAWYKTVMLNPGEMLQAVMKCPNNVNLDYDIFALSLDSAYNITGTVDQSVLGTSGRPTMDEAVGVINNTSSEKIYAVWVQSAMGSSTTDTFTVNISIDNVVNADAFEVNENVFTATERSVASYEMNLNSPFDTDWFSLKSPTTGLYEILGTNSNTEVYLAVVNASGKYVMQPKSTYMGNNSKYSLTAGITYYIRMTPKSADSLGFTRLNISTWSGPSYHFADMSYVDIYGDTQKMYLGAYINYGFQGSYLDVTGYLKNSSGEPVAYEQVTVSYYNPTNGSSYQYRTATGPTDSSGKFTIRLYNGGADYKMVWPPNYVFDLVRIDAECTYYPNVSTGEVLYHYALD